MEKIEPVYSVIKWLMMGGTFKDTHGMECAMDEEDNLCVRLKSSRVDKNGKRLMVWTKMDMHLSTFIQMCRDIPEKELVIMRANIAIKKVNKKKRLLK